MDASALEKSTSSSTQMKIFFLGLLGFVFCIFGIGLIFVFWPDVVALFRSVIGALLAIAGLVLMSIALDDQEKI